MLKGIVSERKKIMKYNKYDITLLIRMYNEYEMHALKLKI